MPIFTSSPQRPRESNTSPRFPRISRDHILHCSYDFWFPKYQSCCIKSRIIPLPPEFIDYIREDGIILADDDNDDETGADYTEWESGPSSRPHRLGVADDDDDDDDDDDSEDEAPPKLPPNQRFPDLHQTIQDKITEVGGAAAPKLNWTSPQDAAWISPHQNTVRCETPNDVYLLLKSSNFINHDLEHAFDHCTAAPGAAPPPFRPVLVLRSFFNPRTALEFRCFVKHRNLVAISQRDLNYYAFLRELRPAIVGRIGQLFNHRLRYTFPDGNFVFDVYIPDGEDEPLAAARLVDINPWAPHTDSLLFGWAELLEMSVPEPVLGSVGAGDEEGVQNGGRMDDEGSSGDDGQHGDGDVGDDDDDDDDDHDLVPELRLIEKEDAAAYNFSSLAYSAHKLPKEVVDASLAGDGGMREFAQRWREMVQYRESLAHANWEST